MTFTKEQLIEQATKNIAVLRGAVERISGASDAAVIHLKLAEITLSALAGMEAEPVAYMRDGYGGTDYSAHKERGGIPLYAAPQPITTSERAELENYRNAQQVVPVDLANKSFEYIANKFQVRISDAQWILVGWNACRAAMLQAGNSPVIPDGWVDCSERMPEAMLSVLVTGEWFNYAIAFWDGRGWCDLDCEPPVTHWQPLPAAPQQEV